MKFLKRVDESWSADYTYDFTDYGFNVAEEGNLLKGEYKGRFVHSDISSWFDEMVAKMGDEHKVIRSKTYFSEPTGHASFEVEVKPPSGSNTIQIDIDGEKHDFNLNSIIEIEWSWRFSTIGKGGLLSVNGQLDTGQKRELRIEKAGSNPHRLSIKFGNKSNGISVSKKDIIKIFDLFYSDKMAFPRDHNTKYSDMIKLRGGSEYKAKIDAIRKDILGDETKL